MVVSAEVLSRLAHMGGDAYGAPEAVRECFTLLLDAFEQQAHKISHLEDAICSYGSTADGDVSVWSKLANKADATKVDRLQQQMAALQAAFDTRQLHEAAYAPEQERMHQQLATLRQHVAHMESALGCANTASHLGQHAAALSGVAARAGSSSSALERLQQLERQVEVLSNALASKEEESNQARARIRDIETQLDSQLKNIRTDAKQAILLSGSATKAEAEAQLAARSREVEHKLVARVEAVEALLESRVASASTRTSAALSGEVDKRVTALYETLDLQMKGLQDQIDKLATDKADMASLSDYTLQVTEVFEQVAVTVSDSSQAGLDDVLQQLEQQRQDLSALAAAKADGHELQTLQRRVHVQLEEVSRDAAELREALEELPGLQNSLQSLEADVAALNATCASSAAALDASARRTQQVSAHCDDLAANLTHLSSAVLGTAPYPTATTHSPGRHTGAAETDSDTSSRSGQHTQQPHTPAGGASIAARLAAAERAVQEAAASVGGKASAAAVAELGRQLEGVRAQAGRNAEGVRSLTSSTYKRVDEHASAIQRLAATIGSSMDDRPTCAAVRKLVQEAVEDASEHLEVELAEQHEALAQLQAGLEVVRGDAASAMREAAGARQAQAELRSMQAARDATLHECVEMVAKDQGTLRETLRQLPGMCKEATSALVKEQLAAELQQASSDSQRRLATLEAHTRSAASTLQRLEEEASQTARQLDRHSGMLSALERASAAAAAARRASEVAGGVSDDVATALKASQAAMGQLRAEVSQQLEACVGRMGGLEEGLREGRDALREGLRGAEIAWRREIGEAAQQEEVRWQVWLEQFADAIERRVTREDLTAALHTIERRLTQQLTAQTNDSITAANRKAAEACSAASAAVDKRVAAVERRVRAVEGTAAAERAAAVAAAATASGANSAGLVAKQLAEIEAVLHGKADKAAVERQLGALRVALAERPVRAEFESELAKKLDIRTFLAASSANARAVGAAGALAAALGPAGGANSAAKGVHPGTASSGSDDEDEESGMGGAVGARSKQLPAGTRRRMRATAQPLRQRTPGGRGTSPQPFK